MLQGVFLGVLFLAKLAMLREKLSEVAIVHVVSRKWDFENASTFLSPSFLPFVDDRQSTYSAKLENKDTVLVLAQQGILSRCVLVGACWGTH
jgi:hypothetical protein